LISSKAHSLLWLATGGALGYLAWHPEATQWWVVALPLLWSASRTRQAAFLVWFGYYLAGARDVPAAFALFFPESWPGWGAVTWLIHAALLTAPWAILWRANAAPQQAMLGTVAALLAATLPPLGILGGLSPLLLAGEAFPGTGWFGLGLTLSILAFVAGCARMQRHKWRAFALLSVVAVSTSLAANSRYMPPSIPVGWTGIDTAMGAYPEDRATAYQRHLVLIGAVETKLKAGAKVIVLPEEIAGLWRAGSQFWWRDTERMAREMNATLVIGADLPADGDRYINGAALLGTTIAILPGRVPMPIGVWRPGQDVSGVPDFLGRGTTHLHGVPVATSICYEDFLLYPLLLSSLDKPQTIISLANNWFATDLAAIWIQRRSIENQARLFGLPLVRAVNLAARGNPPSL